MKVKDEKGVYSLGSTFWRSTFSESQSGALQSQATDFGAGAALTSSGWGLEAGGPDAGLPILDLEKHSPVLKNCYKGTFNVNVV